jgi:hypothetical protein
MGMFMFMGIFIKIEYGGCIIDEDLSMFVGDKEAFIIIIEVHIGERCSANLKVGNDFFGG